MTTPFEFSGLCHASLEILEGEKIRGRPGLMLPMTLYQREKRNDIWDDETIMNELPMNLHFSWIFIGQL